MPIYAYKCNKCNEKFEITCSMQEISMKTMKCHKCKTTKVSRDFQAESGFSFPEPKSLGMISAQNSDKMSGDHKRFLTKKHNEYKEGLPNIKAPKGSRWLRKRSTDE